MPIASTKAVDIYYEIHGTGDPLLMIKGLGHSSKFWFLQLPTLARHFQTLIYDCRGVGGSTKSRAPYSIADDAADAIGLLDSLGIDRAHIVGLSRGGYIAQELAISYPDRVRRLVLMVTHCGGPEYLEITDEVWKKILDVEGLTMEQIFRRGIEYTTTADFFTSRHEMIERLVSMRLEQPQPAHSFKLQFDSAAAFDARERVGRIRAPTLVIAGRQDRIVPVDLVKELARAIPDARLEVLEHAAHLVFAEQPETVNQLLVEFLGEG